MMKRYPSYKDSGIDWIGGIPEGWECYRLKYALSLQTEKAGEVLTDDFRMALENVEGWTGCFIQTDSVFEGEGVRFEKGDLLFGKLRPYLAKVYEAPKSGTAVGEFFVMKPKDHVISRFMFYRLLTKEFIDRVNSSTYGAKMPRTGWEFMGCLSLPIPSVKEQHQIVTFLDRKTAQIDRLINIKQKQIELLKEERTAIINHAVTKGLNSSAKMKDSGIEWIGEVPEHWAIKPLKHIKSPEPNSFVDGPFGSNLKSIHFVEDGDVYVIESSFATTSEIQEDVLKRISQEHFETIKRSECREGDIIIAKIGARFGLSSILPHLSRRSVVSGNSLKLTIDQDNNSLEYIHYLILAAKKSGVMDLLVNETAQPALSLMGLNELKLISPPIAEQYDIVSFVKEKTNRISSVILRTKKQIELFQEYRTTLISEAVTGKIDVREETVV